MDLCALRAIPSPVGTSLAPQANPQYSCAYDFWNNDNPISVEWIVDEQVLIRDRAMVTRRKMKEMDMPRIEALKHEHTSGETRELLDGVKAKMGMVPNLLATLAHSPAALKSYLNLSGAVGSGSLTAQQREQIALVVGQKNDCQYCLSAHSTIGKMVGMSDDAVIAARRGQASEEKSQAILKLATTITSKSGVVSDEELRAARDAGLSDGEILEVVANVALNHLTNFTNHLAGTVVDFPKAPALNA